MIFLQMILQMLTLILIKLGLLNEMVILRAIGAFLLPARNIQLIFSLIIGPNLKIAIEAALSTEF